jgi:hypothetical protein
LTIEKSFDKVFDKVFDEDKGGQVGHLRPGVWLFCDRTFVENFVSNFDDRIDKVFDKVFDKDEGTSPCRRGCDLDG